MFKIQEKLKEILEAEMGEGGRLSGLKKVFIGDRKLIPCKAYPAAMIFLHDIDISGGQFRREIYLSLSIYLSCIGPDTEASFKQAESLLWEDTPTGQKGLLPVLNDNTGIQADGLTYNIKMGTIDIDQGIEGNQRFSTGANIPLTLTTWRT